MHKRRVVALDTGAGALCTGSGDADAGVVCHGSLLNDQDVENIKNPVLFLYSANDKMIPDEKREKFQSILKTKSFPAEGVYYPDQACPLMLRPQYSPSPDASIQATVMQLSARGFRCGSKHFDSWLFSRVSTLPYTSGCLQA